MHALKSLRPQGYHNQPQAPTPPLYSFHLMPYRSQCNTPNKITVFMYWPQDHHPDHQNATSNILALMPLVVQEGAYCCCSGYSLNESREELATINTLIRSHLYSAMKTYSMRVTCPNVRLNRLSNPIISHWPLLQTCRLRIGGRQRQSYLQQY